MKENYKRSAREYQDKYLFGGLREVAIQRDQEMCTKCGMTRDEHRKKWNRDITVDHIDGRGSNCEPSMKNNEISNLRTLCISCHAKTDIHRRRKFSEYSEESKRRVLANLDRGRPPLPSPEKREEIRLLAHELRQKGMSIRQIMRALNYRSPRTIQRFLEQGRKDK